MVPTAIRSARLYDDSFIDTEQFIRLVLHTLRDVGYTYAYIPPPLSLVPLLTPFARESAATLEAESGYSMESPQVSQFRRYVLSGLWSKAEALLACLFPDNDDGLCVCLSPPSPPSGSTHHSQDARFLISQQKYLELLEARKTTAALHVLRNELAPINTETQQLHTLSRSFSFLPQGASCPC